MKEIYLITGAKGHLGNTLVRLLEHAGCTIRALVLPDETAQDHGNVTYYYGDVRKADTMRPLFAHTEGAQVTVIHTAGIVDISENCSDLLYDVNVNGTKTLIAMALEANVHRFVYVSSTHAIPEQGGLRVLREVNHFNPDKVVGRYAETKAEATQAVLDAVVQGLRAVVVHPSGILGPYDTSGNHLVQMVNDYIHRRLPACVQGGYDFVDVRDVARGCLLAARKGRVGECYILSNRHYEVKEVLNMVKSVCGGRRLPALPMWMARAAAPLIGWVARLRRQRPLYTSYSLYILTSNDKFSHDKATMELGYQPRDLYQTVADTVAWLKQKQEAAGGSFAASAPQKRKTKRGICWSKCIQREELRRRMAPSGLSRKKAVAK